MYWKVAVFFVLLLCSGAMSGCGTTSPMTTALSQPQPPAAAHPFHTATQTLDKDFTLALDITPCRSGTNTFLLHITDNHTHQPALHVDITLYSTMQDMAMGTDSLALHADGNGQFSVTSQVLGMSGHWAIGITIQTADHIIHKAGIHLDVPS
jgi:hypothetical protein